MRFLLPVPSAPSGGHIYNRQVMKHAGSAFHVLEPIWVDRGASIQALLERIPGDSGEWFLWDSLLMEALVDVVTPLRSRRHALLVHYLPSLDPLPAPELRKERRSIEEAAAHCVSAYIATGQALGRELQDRYPGKPVFVCEPAVDPVFSAARRRRQRSSSPGLNLLTVANLVPAKGHTQILAALEGLSHLDWQWHLAGDPEVDSGWKRHWLERVEHSGLGERIHWLGPLSQEGLAARMEDMDLFLCASSYEAYGMALAEAVAAGLPVLTTRVGEAERLVRDGREGFLVEFGDWARFQDRLKGLLEDRRLREDLYQAERPAVRTWQDAGSEFAAACQAIQRLNPRS